MIKCPICKHWIEDDDYWAGDRCLRCALRKETDAKKPVSVKQPLKASEKEHDKPD